MKDLS